MAVFQCLAGGGWQRHRAAAEVGARVEVGVVAVEGVGADGAVPQLALAGGGGSRATAAVAAADAHAEYYVGLKWKRLPRGRRGGAAALRKQVTPATAPSRIGTLRWEGLGGQDEVQRFSTAAVLRATPMPTGKGDGGAYEANVGRGIGMGADSRRFSPWEVSLTLYQCGGERGRDTPLARCVLDATAYIGAEAEHVTLAMVECGGKRGGGARDAAARYSLSATVQTALARAESESSASEEEQLVLAPASSTDPTPAMAEPAPELAPRAHNGGGRTWWGMRRKRAAHARSMSAGSSVSILSDATTSESGSDGMSSVTGHAASATPSGTVEAVSDIAGLLEGAEHEQQAAEDVRSEDLQEQQQVQKSKRGGFWSFLRPGRGGTRGERGVRKRDGAKATMGGGDRSVDAVEARTPKHQRTSSRNVVHESSLQKCAPTSNEDEQRMLERALSESHHMYYRYADGLNLPGAAPLLGGDHEDAAQTSGRSAGGAGEQERHADRPAAPKGPALRQSPSLGRLLAAPEGVWTHTDLSDLASAPHEGTAEVAATEEAERDGTREQKVPLPAEVLFATMDQSSAAARGSSACAVLALELAAATLAGAAPQHARDGKRATEIFDELLISGSSTWRAMVEEDARRPEPLFRDGYFDIETALQSLNAERPRMCIDYQRSCIGFVPLTTGLEQRAGGIEGARARRARGAAARDVDTATAVGDARARDRAGSGSNSPAGKGTVVVAVTTSKRGDAGERRGGDASAVSVIGDGAPSSGSASMVGSAQHQDGCVDEAGPDVLSAALPLASPLQLVTPLRAVEGGHHAAMSSGKAVWHSLRPGTYIVAWCDHFTLLHYDGGTRECVVVDSLGERLFPGNPRAFALRFTAEGSDGEDPLRLVRRYFEEYVGDVHMADVAREMRRGSIDYEACLRRTQIELSCVIPVGEDLELALRGGAQAVEATPPATPACV